MMHWLMFLLKRFDSIRTSLVIRVSVLFFILLTYATVGYHYFEQASNPDLNWSDSLWWAIVTMTTVGYGDLYPSSFGGRFLVGFPTMLLGVSILGYVLSVVATAMIESRMKELKGMNKVDLSDHIIICNYISLEKTEELIHEIHSDKDTASSHIVIIDACLDELPIELQDDLIHFVKGCPMRENSLLQANCKKAKAVIVQADNSNAEASDNANLRTILTIESLTHEVYTCVECINPENKIYFERASCDSVICLASLSRQMMVQELQDPGVAEVVTELTTNKEGKQFYMIDLDASCKDFKGVKERYTDADSVVVGVRQQNKNMILPEDSCTVESGDQVILISSNRPT